MPERRFTPSQAMRAAAAAGLLRYRATPASYPTIQRLHLARARNILHGDLPLSTVRRLHSYFSRHPGTPKAGSPDHVAYLLHGGAAGARFARSVLARHGTGTRAIPSPDLPPQRRFSPTRPLAVCSITPVHGETFTVTQPAANTSTFTFAQVLAPASAPLQERAPEFRMLILDESTPTDDGRSFTRGAVTWRDPPLSVLYLTQNNGGNGHATARIGGALTRLWRGDEATSRPDSPQVWGEGFYSTTPEGREFRRLVDDGALSFVSADLVAVEGTVSERPAEAGQLPRVDRRFTKASIAGVTAVPVSAFARTRIAAVAQEQAITAAARAAGYGAAPPPADWFWRDDLLHRDPCPLTVTSEGRVYGHLALWGTCHTAFSDRCVTPPRPGVYSQYLTGLRDTNGGEQLAVGAITLTGGHAPISASAAEAQRHYDDTRSAVADVAVGDDGVGIWFAGALRAGVSAEQVQSLQASALSGDWRSIAGKLSLIAVCAVNVPGFPIPRSARLADDEPAALIYGDDSLSPAFTPEHAEEVLVAAVETEQAPLTNELLTEVHEALANLLLVLSQENETVEEALAADEDEAVELTGTLEETDDDLATRVAKLEELVFALAKRVF